MDKNASDSGEKGESGKSFLVKPKYDVLQYQDLLDVPLMRQYAEIYSNSSSRLQLSRTYGQVYQKAHEMCALITPMKV